MTCPCGGPIGTGHTQDGSGCWASLMGSTTSEDLMINPDDLIIGPYPPRQKGVGIHRAPTGVQVTHKPSGISVVCEEHRSHYQNRNTALEILEDTVEKWRAK